MNFALNKGVSIHSHLDLGLKLSRLSTIFESAYGKFRSKNYSNIAEMLPENISENTDVEYFYSAINSYFRLSDNGFVLSKLWFVKTEQQNIDTAKLPYVPHIDKKRFLKVMIYVDDVCERDGPFFAFSCDPEQYESKRRSLKSGYKDRKENLVRSIPMEHYREFVGDAGSLVVFDTNCPHFAGEVKEGGIRRVIRFDFEMRHWNTDGFLSIIKSKLFR